MEEQLLTAYLCFWLAVLGAVLGSFLDCAASRWAAGDPHPFQGRSRCGSCGHTLGARDLVPVFSFLLRRGRCRWCGEAIPARCLVSELAGAAAFLCLGLRFGLSLELGQWFAFAALLLALSLTDWAARLLPDKLLLLLAANRAAWFFVLGHGVREILEAGHANPRPGARLAPGRAGGNLMGRGATGGGGIKRLFVLALYLSWAELFLTLLAGCLLGLLWAALTGGKAKTAMPFGPFLALGAMLTVCCGGPVLEWYFGLF